MAATATRASKPRRRQQRLREVLKVSARVFADEGYEKASIRRIAAELGRSLSALYYYVRTKEELLYLIQHETFSSLVGALEERIEGVEEPERRLRLMIENHLGRFLSHMNELKVCAYELESLSGEEYQKVLGVRRRYYRLARTIVTGVLERFGNADLDPNLATLNLFGMLNWIYTWYDPERNDSVETLVEQILGLFLFGLASGKGRPETTGRASMEGKRQEG